MESYQAFREDLDALEAVLISPLSWEFFDLCKSDFSLAAVCLDSHPGLLRGSHQPVPVPVPLRSNQHQFGLSSPLKFFLKLWLFCWWSARDGNGVEEGGVEGKEEREKYFGCLSCTSCFHCLNIPPSSVVLNFLLPLYSGEVIWGWEEVEDEEELKSESWGLPPSFHHSLVGSVVPTEIEEVSLPTAESAETVDWIEPSLLAWRFARWIFASSTGPTPGVVLLGESESIGSTP